MHLLGNMLWLYFVGTILEDLIGSKHIVRLFIFGGISGSLIYFIFSQLTGISGLLVGASGGIAALLIATALYAPNYRVFLLGIVEIELRWIVIIKIFFDVVGLLLAAILHILGDTCLALLTSLKSKEYGTFQNSILLLSIENQNVRQL